MARLDLHGVRIAGFSVKDGRLELTIQFAWWYVAWIKLVLSILVLGVRLGILRSEDAECLACKFIEALV